MKIHVSLYKLAVAVLATTAFLAIASSCQAQTLTGNLVGQTVTVPPPTTYSVVGSGTIAATAGSTSYNVLLRIEEVITQPKRSRNLVYQVTYQANSAGGSFNTGAHIVPKPAAGGAKYEMVMSGFYVDAAGTTQQFPLTTIPLTYFP